MTETEASPAENTFLVCLVINYTYHVPLYRETVLYFESKERIGKSCVHHLQSFQENTVHCENCMKHSNTLCKQNAVSL